MPNIEEFQAGPGKIDVADRGAETFAQAGRRAGVAFQQIGEETEKTYDVYHAHQVDVDTTNTYTASSVHEANMLKGLQAVVNRPDAAEHPEWGQALVEQYRQDANDIAGHASTDEGKRLGLRLAAERTEQYTARVASEFSVLAANKTVQNYQTQEATSRSAVTDDPSQLAHQLAVLDDYYATNTPHNLSPEEIGHLGQEKMEAKARVAASALLSAAHQGEEQIALGREPTALTGGQKILDDGLANDLPGFDKAQAQERLDIARTRGEERFRAGQAVDQKADEDGAKGEFAQARALMQPDINGNVDPNKERQAMAIVAAIPGRHPKGIGAISGDLDSFSASVKATADDRLTHKFTQDDPTALQQIRSAGGDLSLRMLDDLHTQGLLSQKTYEDWSKRAEHMTSDPAYKQALDDIKTSEDRLRGLFGISAAGSLSGGANLPREAAFNQWTMDNRRRADAWIASGEAPQKVNDIMFNQSNRNNVVQGIQDYVKRADQAGSVAALNASFLSNPEPIALTDLATHNPGAAATEQNLRPAATGAKPVPAGLSKDDAAWLAAHRKSEG